MIAVDSLAVAYGDVPVLEDVSLSVSSGTVLGLVGPNGAGKTTLLRAMSGAIAPDRGTVTIDGADVHGLSSRAASQLVSVVPQDTTLSFSFDVRDVVEMGRTPHRSRFAPVTREDFNKVDRALERTRTSEFADRSIDEVSGGERQRVILARAIAQDTPVVLLDEPTASLDVAHQVGTLELVRELAADGRTVVAAIHDLDLAARFCDELAALANGTILETGRPEAVLSRELLERSFGANAVVTTDPVTGRPRVTTLPRAESERALPERVHVVGTGSTAASVISRLASAGVTTSVGPVAASDVAAATARRVDVDRIEVPPLSPVSESALEATRNRVAAADVTLLADPLGGEGVGRVLEALEGAASLIRVESESVADRPDEGAPRLDQPVAAGAVDAPLEDVLAAVAAVTSDERRSDPDRRTATED